MRLPHRTNGSACTSFGSGAITRWRSEADAGSTLAEWEGDFPDFPRVYRQWHRVQRPERSLPIQVEIPGHLRCLNQVLCALLGTGLVGVAGAIRKRFFAPLRISLTRNRQPRGR